MAHVARPIGDLDLHLFGEGTHRRLWELLGPQPLLVDESGSARSIRFGVWAPNAAGVAVIGDWNDWAPEPLAPVVSDVPTGIWTVVAPEAQTGHRYKFVITTRDGRTLHKADPMARQSERPPSDASVVPTSGGHGWTDDDWMHDRRTTLDGTSPLRIYEVHLASWKRSVDTWDELATADRRSRRRVSGSPTSNCMPIAEHPFGGSWGYQVSGYYSPTARFGDPDGLRRFVDEMHRRRYRCDRRLGARPLPPRRVEPRPASTVRRCTSIPTRVVASTPTGGPTCSTTAATRSATSWSSNALYWLDQFHVDGLRVDAVASMLYLDYSRAHGEWTPQRVRRA